MSPKRLDAKSSRAALVLISSLAVQQVTSILPYVIDFDPEAPAVNGFQNASLHSWGGGVIEYPPSSGNFHLYASAFSESCGLNAWATNSEVIHAVGTSPTGPFAFRDVALPVYHHNAQPIVAPDGTFLIFAIGMDPQGGAVNCSESQPHRGDERRRLEGSGHGPETVECWSSPSVDGPWTPVLNPNGGYNGRNLVNSTNPSPFFDPSGNGSLWVAGHDAHSNIVVFSAPSWRGPYDPVSTTLFASAVDDYVGEDPFLWYDATRPNAEGTLGAWRVLYHMYNASDTQHQVRVGGYAESAGPAIFSPWSVQSNAVPAYTTNATFAGGEVVTLSRRERPKLFFSAAGQPSVLYTGVCPQTSGSNCYTLAIPIAGGGD